MYFLLFNEENAILVDDDSSASHVEEGVGDDQIFSIFEQPAIQGK
jgi:hypothetical protein